MKKTETDSFPRVTARDLFMVLQVFDRQPETTLENIRLRICVDRKKQRKGTFLWSAARDTAAELVRLGLVEGACHAKNTQQYETMKKNRLSLTGNGNELLQAFKTDRAGAYDDLLSKLVAKHPYLQRFIAVISRGDVLAPVISSMRDHVADRYSANAVLATDVSKGEFEFASFLSRLSTRLKRTLTNAETDEITRLVEKLVSEARPSALHDDTTRFAKNLLNKLNDITIPAIFRQASLGFDFRTHRTLWSIGQEFRVWAVTRSHPEYDGWLVYLTCTLQLADNQSELADLSFDYGLARTRENFLGKLHAAYQKLSALKSNTFVSAWELRAVFCLENRCQPSVFNKLFGESYTGSGEYELQLEIQRQKPQHEESLRANNRNVGAVRVVRR